MAWLFERTIELAAWVAFILGVVLLFDAGYQLVQWGLSVKEQTADPRLLYRSGQSAGGFVLTALCLGGLACIDRYVFDADDRLPR